MRDDYGREHWGKVSVRLFFSAVSISTQLCVLWTSCTILHYSRCTRALLQPEKCTLREQEYVGLRDIHIRLRPLMLPVRHMRARGRILAWYSNSTLTLLRLFGWVPRHNSVASSVATSYLSQLVRIKPSHNILFVRSLDPGLRRCRLPCLIRRLFVGDCAALGCQNTKEIEGKPCWSCFQLDDNVLRSSYFKKLSSRPLFWTVEGVRYMWDYSAYSFGSANSTISSGPKIFDRSAFYEDVRNVP